MCVCVCVCGGVGVYSIGHTKHNFITVCCVCVHCTCVCTFTDFQLSKLKVTFVCRDKDERSLQKSSRQQHHLCTLVKYHSPLKHTNSFI